MKKHTVLIFLVFLFFINIHAEKAPMKYGKVDLTDLQMKVYPADSSASAVVLCSYGYFDGQELQFVHQMRIKILKEEGKDNGNFSVPTEEKTNVRGQTVNLENGVPVVTKLNKDGIFIERVTKNSYRARVAMPNVKVGSVIDVEFYYTGLPAYWDFQKTIPMRWSELVIDENENFSFRKNLTGYIPLAESTNDRWVTKDVPAFKAEKFINNSENYLSRMNIEISSIHFPGRLYKDYATDWEAVAKTLRDADDFGQQLTTLNFFLNGLEKEIKSTATTPEDKLSKAYEAIKKIKWNNEESLTISKNGLSYAFNKKIGNSADINLTLVILLRKLGIDANPIVLSTRNNGLLPSFSVSLDRLNYVMAQAIIGDKKFFLDATDENLPLGMLPERAINGRGLVIKKESHEWIDLTPEKKDKSTSIFNLQLSADGVLKGDWTKLLYDYSALNHRIKYKKYNSQDEYLKSLESDYVGLSVEKYNLVGIDSIQKPVQENMTIILKNRITKANNQMYINPLMFDKYTENPFKTQERVYPVDFTTPREETQIFNLELPAGSVIDQLPKNIKMALPDNTASFQMFFSVEENMVHVLFKLNINKPVFLQAEYKNLKIFFDELVKKQAEMLIIKKV